MSNKELSGYQKLKNKYEILKQTIDQAIKTIDEMPGVPGNYRRGEDITNLKITLIQGLMRSENQ